MNTKFDKTIRKCIDSLRGYFAYEDCSKIFIYIVFLKYIIDNKKITFNTNTFNVFLNAQRMFYQSDLEKEVITNLNYIIENHFNMASGSLTEFSNLYFRVVEFKKPQRTNIIEELKSITFENESEALIDSLKAILFDNASNFGRIMGDAMSTQSLSKLVKEILTLEENERFADFTYGYGLSSLEITKDVKCKLTGYDIQKQTSTMAIMLLIIAEKENFDIYNEDITRINIPLNSFDKISSFPPLGIKVREFASYTENLLQEFGFPVKTTNLEVLIALQGIKSLKENGTMVLSITPNNLCSATTVEKKFRELITKKYLSAVITLPSLYYGTSIATNLIILERNRKLNNILFVNARSNEFFPFEHKDKKYQNDLTDEAINKIIEIIKDRQIIDGISYSCSIDEIIENDFILSPSRYVQIKREKQTLSNKEINEQLKNLYNKLKEIIK